MNKGLENFEKVLLGFIMFGLFAALIPSFFQGTGILSFFICVLGWFYTISGYWLFKETHLSKFQSTCLGLIFGISLYVLSERIDLILHSYLIILFIPHVILILILGIQIFKYRHQINIISKSKFIYKRAFVIFGFTSFFLFMPISFKPYRKIVMFLNEGNTLRKANLTMYDHKLSFDEAYKKGNCNKAIYHAEKSNRNGLKWIGINSIDKYNEEKKKSKFPFGDLKNSHLLEESEIQRIAITENRWPDRLDPIGGTFEALFEAYMCEANNLSSIRETEDAISFYKKAYKVTSDFNRNTNYWNIGKVESLSLLAKHYALIENYDLADSLYIECFESYSKYELKNEKFLVDIVLDFGKYLTKRELYSIVDNVYEQTITILDKMSGENASYIKVYIAMIDNLILTDELETALHYLNKAIKLANKDSLMYCNIQIRESLIDYKKSNFIKSRNNLLRTLECYNNFKEKESKQRDIYYFLSYVNYALANYIDTEECISKAIELFKKEQNGTKYLYADLLLVYGKLKIQQGDYTSAKQKIKDASQEYINVLGNDHVQLYECLIWLAEVEYLQSNKNIAIKHLESARKIFNNLDIHVDIGNTDVLFHTAKLEAEIGNYKLADSIYNQILEYNSVNFRKTTVHYANTLRGLGELQLKLGQYKKAEELLNKALSIYKPIYVNGHPDIAKIYTSLCIIYCQTKEWSKSEEYCNKSFNMLQKKLKSDHYLLGDLFEAKADMLSKQNKKSEALLNYKKSITIYRSIFGDKHRKIQIFKTKINALE